MYVVEADDVAVSDSAAAQMQATIRKVLVVDDDPAMRRLVSKILGTAGYEVLYAADGREAVDVLNRHLPGFVITDWDMPVLDGAEFCRIVRAENLPHYVYIVMLTGTHVDRLVEGLAAGADDFITKPLHPAELLARMKAGARVLHLEGQLRLLASHDSLTGLLNRRTFFQAVDDEWQRAARVGYPLSGAMIDVDYFKRVNDLYGHQVGDAALQTISARLADCCRQTDYVCRYGGEEFCVLMPDTDRAAAGQWAERYRTAVADQPVTTAERSIPVTVSLGVAQRNPTTRNPEHLLERADRALLAAKANGRNRVEVCREL